MSISTDLLLRLGNSEEFGRVRGFLQRAAFEDAALCRKLGIENMSQLDLVLWDQQERGDLSAPLRWCLRVFARGLLVPEAESRALCGDEVFAAFLSLGLLQRSKLDQSAILCPAWVYPVDGLVVASDRRNDPERGSFAPPEDVVFPAIYGGTLRFLELLPEAHGGDALDLCGGSGIGALRLSRTARSATTTDLTQRSAFFAEFNARLNGVQMHSFCGDLYDPVPDLQFDLITAHPPFVPATGEHMAYRDGGNTGEEVTRRIIEGLPAHLRPGGVCVILCVARDTADQAFELRARDWLSSNKDEFDILFGLEKVLTVEEVVESMQKRGQRIGDDGARQLLERLRSLGTRQFVYGALFINRCSSPVSHPPLRLRLTLAGRAADFEALLAWRRHCRKPGFEQWLAEARPRLAPQLELNARHLVRDGELAPAEFVFSISNGFEARLRPDAFVIPLLARLNGSRSVAEVFQQAAAADELPQGFTLDAFAGLVRTMIERGFFQVEYAN
jgi:SAM-dependent methyltransferase